MLLSHVDFLSLCPFPSLSYVLSPLVKETSFCCHQKTASCCSSSALTGPEKAHTPGALTSWLLALP